MTERRVALGVTVLGLVAFVALAMLLVPWDPVPGGTLVPADPHRLFTDSELALAEEYAGPSRLLSWTSLAVSLLVVGLLGFTALGRRLLGRLPGWGRARWWLQVPYAVAVVDLVGRLATLPFSVALRHRALEYGLSTQPWTAYARDVAVGEVLDVVVLSLVLLVVVGLARRWRRTWTVAGAGLAGLMVFLGSYLYPVVVEPLFAEFTPLQESTLRQEVFALAEAEGVEIDEVLVSDASRRTTTVNAYVSGIGDTRRVVLFDTLVEGLPRDQAVTVVAHELAHAKYDDVMVGTALGVSGAVAGVGLLGLVPLGRSAVTTRRARTPDSRGQKAHFDGEVGDHGEVGDPGAVPRVLALLAVATLLVAPVQNGISRLIETRADVTALVATDDPDAFVGMQVELARRSLSDVTPPAWAHWWFGSHPETLTRIALADRVPRTTP